MERRPTRALIGVLTAAVTVLAAGCVAIPTDSSPQPMKSFDRRPAAPPPPRPDASMDPEAAVHAFLRATADPTAAHSAARAFLTQDSGARWDDRGDTAVLSNINVLLESRTDNDARVRIVGDNTASLKVNGQLLPATGRVEASLKLAHTSAGWRIDGPLPTGVLLDRTQFESTYRLVTLYFTDRGHQRLVGDPRWFFGGQVSTSSVVARMLAGPSIDLEQSVGSAIGPKTQLGEVTRRDQGGVRINLTDGGAPSDADRQLMAAQIVWTLSSADAPAPYEVILDGQPLLRDHPDGLQLAQVQRYSPTALTGQDEKLDVISGGTLSSVEPNALRPVGGNLNDGRIVASASLSHDRSRVAAVRAARPDRSTAAPDVGEATDEPSTGGTASLVTGPYGGAVTQLDTGTTITRPSFGADSEIWAVVDGRPTRWAPGGADPRGAVADTTELAALAHGPITDLQVSPDGVRVALIVGGQVIFAVIGTGDDGRLVLAHPRFAAFNIGNRAVALDWASPTTLVVGRDAAETPVTQVPISGLPAAGLVTGNLAPPVRAVAANLSATYVADTRGVLMLSSSTRDRDQTWVDVPAAKGADMVPVLP